MEETAVQQYTRQDHPMENTEQMLQYYKDMYINSNNGKHSHLYLTKT